MSQGLHVFTSNRIEHLAAQAAYDMALLRARRGVWEPIPIVVPNPNVKDYLRSAFAEALGVAANLRFHFMEGFWRHHLGADPSRRLLDRTTLQGLLLSLLEDPELLASPALAPVHRYLDGEPRDLKRVQLATRLARLFDRYLVHRPDWMKAWAEGRTVRGLEAAGALWQGALWQVVKARLDAQEPPVLPLPDWLEGKALDEAAFPAETLCFGLNHMAPLYHQAFARLGERTTLRLYLLAPTREPWDADPGARSTLRLGPGAEGEDPYGLDTPGVPPLLARWARPAREQLRLLNEVAQGEFLAGFSDPGTDTALAGLQTLLLEGGHPDLPADGTVTVLPCPTPHREAETVASLVWQALEATEGLHVDDICVLVPPSEEETYLAALDRALGADPRLPWAKAMGASRALHQMVEGAQLLMGLATGDLTRADLLRAATHPALAARWGEDVQVATWAGLCERAGIVSHLDAEGTAGTYREDGAWTWQEGLARLALGAFQREGVEVPEAPGYRGLPVASSEATPLVAILGDLARDLRAVGQGRLTPQAWVERLTPFLRTWLLPDATQAPEAEVEALGRLLEALEGLRRLEGPGHAPHLDFPAFRPLVTATLESLLSDRALPPGRGIQVGCSLPLRALPFRMVILMGLGEGMFPTAPRPDPLDLTQEGPRRAGDVSPTEQDRQLFLEAILCTRDRLVLTYPSRDSLTGETLQPSPLLLDLQEVLGASWDAIAGPEQPRHRHDRRAHPHLAGEAEPGIVPLVSTDARQEAELRMLGEALREHTGGRDLPLRLSEWKAPHLVEALAPRLLASPSLGPAAPLPERFQVTLGQLRAWLECPVQGGEALRLGIREQDVDMAADLVQEPLDSDALQRHILVREVFWGAVADPSQDLDTHYARLRRRMEAQARVPRGPLAEGEWPSLRPLAQTWLHLLGDQPVDVPRLGTASQRSPLPLTSLPTLTLDLDLGDRRLRIDVEGLGEPMSGSDILLLSKHTTGPGPKSGLKVPPKDRQQSLRAWVQHVALSALGQTAPRRIRLLSASDRPVTALLPLPALTPEEARDLLAGWLREALVEAPRELLPVEALFLDPAPRDLRSFVDETDGLRCLRGPVPHPRDLPVAPSLEPGQLRLGAFLDLQDRWTPLEPHTSPATGGEA